MRRRMIAQNLNIDEEFNKLSIEAQNIFIRMLAVSDDFGIVPANLYTLTKLINPPKMKKSLMNCLNDIVFNKLGKLFKYQDKEWFMFKRDSFDRINSYIITKRTKSEYLNLTKDFIDSEKFLEIIGNYSDVGTTSIISNKQQVVSNKQETMDSLIDKDKDKEMAKDKNKDAVHDFQVPTSLNTKEFLESWGDFIKHRKQIKKPLTDMSAKMQLKKLAEIPVEEAIKRVEQSIANGWQGIFEVKDGNNKQAYKELTHDGKPSELQRILAEQIKAKQAKDLKK